MENNKINKVYKTLKKSIMINKTNKQDKVQGRLIFR